MMRYAERYCAMRFTQTTAKLLCELSMRFEQAPGLPLAGACGSDVPPPGITAQAGDVERVESSSSPASEEFGGLS